MSSKILEQLINSSSKVAEEELDEDGPFKSMPWEVERSIAAFSSTLGLNRERVRAALKATTEQRRTLAHIIQPFSSLPIPGIGVTKGIMDNIKHIETMLSGLPSSVRERLRHLESLHHNIMMSIKADPKKHGLVREDGLPEDMASEGTSPLEFFLDPRIPRKEGTWPPSNTVAIYSIISGKILGDSQCYTHFQGPAWSEWLKTFLDDQSLLYCGNSQAYATVPFQTDPLFGVEETMRQFQDELKTSQRILLLGPPGTGKTSLVDRVVKNAKLRALRVPMGHANTNASNIYTCATVLQLDTLVLDDIDTWPDGWVKCFIDTMSEYKFKGYILMTANSLKNLDRTLLRPGRIDRILEIDLPRATTRKVIFESFFEQLGCQVKPVELRYLVKITKGMSQSYIRQIAVQLRVKPYVEILGVIRDYSRLQVSVSTEDSRRIRAKMAAQEEQGVTVADIKKVLEKVAEETEEEQEDEDELPADEDNLPDQDIRQTHITPHASYDVIG